MSARAALALSCLLLLGCPATLPPDAGVDAGGERPDAGDAGAPDAGPPRFIITPNDAGWWQGKVFYEIFVRSFYDTDGNGVGDLQGVTAKLDTLTALGVDALWLMPIAPAASYHGYDVTDYQAVSPDYGTLEDFDALLAAAHQRGLKVILDFVPNHTSARHPWFLGAQAGDAALRERYVWSPTDPGWKRPTDQASLWHQGVGGWYYGYFWSGMPDLNFRNAQVRAAIVEAMKFWLRRGADGFRVDAARYLYEAPDAGARGISEQPETLEFTKELRFALHQEFPQALLVAESYSDTATAVQYFGQGDAYQLAFNFDLAFGMVNSLMAGNASELINTIARNERTFAAKGVTPDFDAPFLTNHDLDRVMRKLGGNIPAAKVAAATLLALPGTPFLYYGEELGMGGGPSPRDEDKRTPMRWTATPPQYGFTTRGSAWFEAAEDAGVNLASQQADPQSLWNTYRELISLRRAQPALARGATKWLIPVGATPAVFALLRTEGAQRVLYLANFGAAAVGAFTVAVDGAAQATVLRGTGLVGTPSAAAGVVSVGGLDAYGFVHLSLP